MMKLLILAFLATLISSSIALKGKLKWIELNDGNKIPTIGHGTPLKDVGEADDVVKAIETAITTGYRLIDTAEFYNKEELVGKAIQNKIKDGTIKRENLFVITKLKVERHGKDIAVAALEKSLKRLGLSYVDMYLVHDSKKPIESKAGAEVDCSETWKGMEDCKIKGLAKSIGVSNFNDTLLTKLFKEAKIKPAVNEIEANPDVSKEKIVKFCKKNDITVLAYCSDPNHPKINDPKIAEIAKKYGKTTRQVGIRFALHRGVIPILRNTSPDRIKEYFEVFDFCLTHEEIKLIESIVKVPE